MRTTIPLFCVVGLTMFAGAGRSLANPAGGSVVGGDANATISGEGTSLTTINQSAQQVVINWQDFSIGAGETTRFVQPSATAAALNRVVSGNPSEIYGSLQANGRVFVINPNGILVGPSGQIDTKGFVASTLDIPDASFLSGSKLIFSGDSTASVRNEGSIQALGGDVYLIAHSVDNAGMINAPQGTVGLAAGSSVQLVQSGDEHLSVLAGNSSAPSAVGVNNSGAILAASAELKAAGGNIYALAINNGGVVRATGIVNKDGHIYLAATGGNIQNSGTLAANNADGSGGTVIVDGGHNAGSPSTVTSSGTIEASGTGTGTRGGLVELLGDHVGLFDSALVNVSGYAGGGASLIGGDLHGANPDIQNAQATFISPNAQINADALTLGDGGKVVVWSDDTTRFYGKISARGGLLGGDGGFVEVSGHQSLAFEGIVDAAAPAGIAGQLLLDPGTLYIINGGSGDQDGNLTSPKYTIAFGTANTSLNTVSVGKLQSLNNVNITLDAVNTITIGDSSGNPADVNLSGLTSKTLTLSAGDGSGGSGNVVFNSGSSIETGGGNVTINAGQPGDTDGTITLGGVSISGGALTLNALNGVSFNGAVNAGAVTLNNVGAATGSGLITATTLTLNGNGTVGGSGTPLYTAAGTLVDDKSGGDAYVNQTGVLNLDGTTTGVGLLNVVGNAGITIDAALNIDNGAAAGDKLTLNGTTMAINNPVTADAVTLNNSGTVTGSGLITATTLTLNGNGTVGTSGTPLQTAAGTLVDDKSGGDTYVSQSGALNLNGTTTGAGLLDVLGTGITVNGALNIDNGSVAGDILTLNGTTMAINNPVTADAVTLNNSGAVTGSGLITATTLTLNGNGKVGMSGTPLQTAAGTLVDDKSGGDAYVGQTGALNLNGTTTGTGLLDVLGTGITVNGALNIGSGALGLTSSGAISINYNLTAGSVTIHSGTDGSGNLTFGSGVAVRADTQFYQAGDGPGGAGTTALAYLTANSPTFLNAAGSGAPINFTYRQDNSIASTDVPLITPATYVIESDDGSVQLPGLGPLGNLQVIASGPISQNGPLRVGDTATFAAGPGNDITLNNPGNDFNNIIITSGKDVSLYDINDIALGPQGSTVTGNLSVTAGGSVNFSGSPITTVGGNLTVNAGGNLNGAYSVAGTVSITVGGQNNGSLATALAGLAQVTIPVPRPETASFNTATISLSEAAKLLPPGSIGTLWLQIPFPPARHRIYRIEDISKWTSGPLAAVGSTSGPQVPK